MYIYGKHIKMHRMINTRYSSVCFWGEEEGCGIVVGYQVASVVYVRICICVCVCVL